MPDQDVSSALNPEIDGSVGPDRRKILRSLSSGTVGAIVAASAGGLALTLGSKPAEAVTDNDILNFALNFEYLGAEYYLRAIGQPGLPPALLTGTNTQGTVIGGSPVPFGGSAIGSYAQRLAVDELAHVEFLRAVLGPVAISEPTINLETSWTTLAQGAGLITAGQIFNPFADPVSFLLGAYILEDVCVTALAGAAALLTLPDNVAAAAGLLGTESYQAGAIRTLLSDLGAGQATDAISAFRAKLSGVADDVGTLIPGNAYNFVPNDINGLIFRRTPAQILNIVYGGGAVSNFGFFPQGVNGTIN